MTNWITVDTEQLVLPNVSVERNPLLREEGVAAP